MNNFSDLSPKQLALIAHVPVIGFVIALLQYNDQKNDYLGFYLRQMLGITILGVLSSYVRINIFGDFFFSNVVWIATVVLWAISFLSAFNEEKKPIPVLGDYFQVWFKNL